MHNVHFPMHVVVFCCPFSCSRDTRFVIFMRSYFAHKMCIHFGKEYMRESRAHDHIHNSALRTCAWVSCAHNLRTVRTIQHCRVARGVSEGVATCNRSAGSLHARNATDATYEGLWWFRWILCPASRARVSFVQYCDTCAYSCVIVCEWIFVFPEWCNFSGNGYCKMENGNGNGNGKWML